MSTNKTPARKLTRAERKLIDAAIARAKRQDKRKKAHAADAQRTGGENRGLQRREDRRRMGTAASHPLQLRGGNEHSQRTGTAHPGRHRQHQKRRVRELHDRRQTRRLSRKKRVSSQLFKCCKNTRHGAGNRTRVYYGANAVQPAFGNASPNHCIQMGSSPAQNIITGIPRWDIPVIGAGVHNGFCFIGSCA